MVNSNGQDGQSSRPQLNEKQEVALEALLRGNSQKNAAIAAGVTPQTIHRWLLSDHPFSAEFKRRTGSTLEHATDRLMSSVDMAISIVQSVATNKKAKPAIQLRAAGIILDSALRLMEMRLVVGKITEIEQVLDEKL